MMRNLSSGYWLIVVCGLLRIMTVAAACFFTANFRPNVSKAGGQYTYITEIFGKTRVLYGWGMFSVIQTGTIAAVAVAFGKFSAYLFLRSMMRLRFSKVANLKLLGFKPWYCGDFVAHLHQYSRCRKWKIPSKYFTGSKIVKCFWLDFFRILF